MSLRRILIAFSQTRLQPSVAARLTETNFTSREISRLTEKPVQPSVPWFRRQSELHSPALTPVKKGGKNDTPRLVLTQTARQSAIQFRTSFLWLS